MSVLHRATGARPGGCVKDGCSQKVGVAYLTKRDRAQRLMEVARREPLCLKCCDRASIIKILRHYPSSPEIATWANEDARESSMFGSQLAPEHNESNDEVSSSRSLDIPCQTECRATSPSERLNALREAWEFFRSLQCSGDHLTIDQHRQILFVLRHFSDTAELACWASFSSAKHEQFPNARVWIESK